MNRTQAKLLAPIICAYAAGSRIEARDPRVGEHWYPFHGTNLPIESAIALGLELRIAPKPLKIKLARIALCNLAKVTDENFATFPATGVQPKAMEEGWLAAELIVRGGDCDLFEQHPTFVKWISEPFQLVSGKHAA